MHAHPYPYAGRFTRAVSFEDGRALWEAKRWPRTIASASADALAYLDLLLEQLAGSLTSEKAAFEAALATYPDKVGPGVVAAPRILTAGSGVGCVPGATFRCPCLVLRVTSRVCIGLYPVPFLLAQVLEFFTYGDISKSEQIAEQAHELQDTFKQALATVKAYNRR